jgi:diacylglycerol kinase family enzyme
VRSVLIVNPRASKVTEPLVEQVARALDVTEVLRTERGGHATELVAGLVGVERIYVFSGDGGFNEALNGSDGRTPLGFVPGGGTSVLPRALGLPRDPIAGGTQARGRESAADLTRPRQRTPLRLRAGVGLDAELIRRMDARGRDESGRRPGRPRLRVDGREDACRALGSASTRCSRSRATDAPPSPWSPTRIPTATSAGFRSGSRAEPRSTGSRPARAPFLPGALAPGAISYILTGRHRLPLVHLHDADRIEIRCDLPMPLQLDGEDIGDVTEAVFEAERDASPSWSNRRGAA